MKRQAQAEKDSRYLLARQYNATRLGRFSLMLVALLVVTSTLYAATGTWIGGAGATWNTASNNWSGISSATPWDSGNGANNIADFSTAGATPSVIGTIYVNGITFEATAKISGGTAITLAGASPTITANAAATNSSVLSGSSGLITTGAGTLTLDANNSYTGGTTVNGGTLVLNKGGSTGAIRGALTINSGATVQLNVTDALGYSGGSGFVTNITINGGTLNNNVSGNNSASANWVLNGGTMSSTNGGSFNIGYLGVNSLTTLASATQSTINGPVTLRSGNSLTITVADGPAATDLLISSNISQNGGTSGIIKEGAGCLMLSAWNSYSGGTTVNGGTLALNYGGTAAAIPGPLTINPGATVSLTAANALGWQAGWSVTNININGGTLDNALASANNGYLTTLYLTGGTVTGSGGWGFSFADTVDPVVSYASATTSVISASLAMRSSGSNNHTFTVAKGTTPNGIDLKISGVISEYSSTAGLIKTGTGTLLLSGFNTYHGPTTVSNGTLLVNGSVTGTVTVVVGGTLGGTGVVAGVVTNSGAITAGADLVSPGVFTVSNLVMGANTTYNWKYNATTNDEVVVLQKLVLPEVATVNVSRVMSGSLPAKGILFSYGSLVTNAGTLNGWVITGARPDTHAMVSNNQVLLVSPTGMILEIQ